jgi:excisionase family DNA binding protein
MPLNDLLDVNEAAEFCHVRPSTMRDWILRRKIEYVKIGRKVFLRRKSLEDLITRGSVPALQPLPGAEQVAVTA